MASLASKTKLREKNLLAMEDLRKKALLERKKIEKPFLNNADPDRAKNIYNFLVRDIHGQPVSLKRYKGYVCLFVNIAITNSFSIHNFVLLKELCSQFADQPLRILLFPCNQFDQPESKVRTADYVKYINEYGGLESVHLYGKVKVNCDRSSPAWHFLKKNVDIGPIRVIMNPFEKFVVTQYGDPVGRLGPASSREEVHAVLKRLGLEAKPLQKKFTQSALQLRHGGL